MHADCVPILQDVPPGEPIGGCSVVIAGTKASQKEPNPAQCLRELDGIRGGGNVAKLTRRWRWRVPSMATAVQRNVAALSG